MISTEYREAIVEVLEILQHTDKEILDKIPKELLKTWEENKSKTYIPKLDYTKKLNDMDLKPKTRAIITMIYRDYICNDDERKDIDKILIENENKLQEKLRLKYNPDEIFKTKEKNNTNTSIVVVKKQNLFKRILQAIKKYIKLK